MKLIAGLGNPGKEYEKTRHNAGFLALDALSKKCHTDISTKKFDALISKVNIEGEGVILALPQTYMNLSGSSISQIVSFYQIDPEDILIIHDDMDLPVGSLRIRKKGSAGGQKGMKSIIQSLKTEEITRIKIGVGHSEAGNHDLVPDWVLSPVSKADWPTFEKSYTNAANAAYDWVCKDFNIVMSTYNTKVKNK